MRNLSLLVGWTALAIGLPACGADTSRMETTREASAEETVLEEVEWQAVEISDGSDVVSTATTGLSTATFAEGRVSGNAGCNRYQAAYGSDAGWIDIQPAMTTRMLCQDPPGIMEQERLFLQALSGRRSIDLSAERLELRDEAGVLQVAFRIEER